MTVTDTAATHGFGESQLTVNECQMEVIALLMIIVVQGQFIVGP